ncbi:MAG: VOC family protein [Alphaproteobacteria bacterium]
MTSKPRLPTPSGVIPYLTVSSANAAAAFYRDAFGARELYREEHKPTGKIMHLALEMNGGRLFLSDDFPEMNDGKSKAPSVIRGSSVTLHMQVENVDATVVTAVQHGATMVFPVSDMFWGDRFGKIKDPFGHEWSISTPITQIREAEAESEVVSREP